MTQKAAKRFRAVIEPLQGGLGGVVAWIPFDVEAAWKNMVRLRVKVEVGGELFRTSLFTATKRGGHFLLENKNLNKVASDPTRRIVHLTLDPHVSSGTARR